MPDIYDSSFDKIYSNNRRLASVYVPEWKPLDNSDLGVALIEIFSHMQEEIYSRLNRVPEKSFISFLDMIGQKLVPAEPAAVPVTFSLAQGMKESVLVPAGTQVATAETDSHAALTYETVKSFTAIRATIEQILSTNPEKDEIFSHGEDYSSGRPFRPFQGENIQKHAVYLGHNTLFKQKEPKPIYIILELDGDSGIEDIKSWRWSLLDGKPLSVEISRLSTLENSYQIVLLPDAAIEAKAIEGSGLTSLWIECSKEAVNPEERPVVIKKIMLSGGSSEVTTDPDMAFYNFLPLDLSHKFYPFGKQPRLYDTFYLSSSEAFSKKGAKITIAFQTKKEDGSIPADPDNVSISWEYWNGTIWQALRILQSSLQEFELSIPGDGSIQFARPDDLSDFEVNGVRGLWIRARLVSGSFGGDLITPSSVSGEKFFRTTPDFKPPWASSIKISYRLTEESFPEHCLSINNGWLQDITSACQGRGFKPFLPLPDKSPTIYLGFKDPLQKGNLNLYFSMFDEQRPEPNPGVIWSYWTAAPDLIEMISNDHSSLSFASTDGLGVGTELSLQESLPCGFASETGIISSIRLVSGNEMGRLGIADLSTKLEHLYSSKSSILRKSQLDVVDGTERLSRSGILEVIGPTDHQQRECFGKTLFWLMGRMNGGGAAMIRGIYPNTAITKQMQSFRDEILGSCGGEKDSVFVFIRRPVISPEVWVREGARVSEAGLVTEEVKDRSGKVTDVWVKWHLVEDFSGSGARDRDYSLDGSTGELIFGDGINGMIPPIGKDNIKASYKSGGGLMGNVAAGEINAIKTPVPGIDRVRNYLPAEGGSDGESINSLLERGPYAIRTMDRAVTEEDYERLARASSSFVARARVIVNGSRLKVVIIPRGPEERPVPSLGLRKIVKDYLLARSLSTIAQCLEVIAPDYKEIRVKVDVIPKSIDLAISLERSILVRLKEFLHPLTGGTTGEGWDFGRPVRISDIYSILETMDGVDHVEGLFLNDSTGDVAMAQYELACSGDHSVTIKLGDRL